MNTPTETQALSALRNEEIEDSLIGSLIIDPEALLSVKDIVSKDDFSMLTNAEIYDVMLSMMRNNLKIDVVTLGDELKRRGKLEFVGGAAGLMHLINIVPTALHAVEYARAVVEYSGRRKLLKAADVIARAAFDTTRDWNSVVNDAEGAVVDAVINKEKSSSVYDAKPLMESLYDTMFKPVKYIETGIYAFDKELSGLESGLYYIAGRPGMGKTSVCLQMMANMCRNGNTCLFFTVEMSAQQLASKLAASLAEVEYRTFNKLIHKRSVEGLSRDEDSWLTDAANRYGNAMAEMSELKFRILDSSCLKPSDVQSGINRAILDFGSLNAVFVDGLWLMTPEKYYDSPVATLTSISKALKQIQRSFDIPLIVTHQLSRACEARNNKRPLLSDLRDSGSVEQDADLVIMNYRDGEYDKNSPIANIHELIIRKNRLNGPSNVTLLSKWIGKFQWLERVTEQEAIMFANHINNNSD